ncbi:MAG: MBL fold metallo-hydrolase [Muribaculaceae bacterium]|nr:MBL fold metallo-hydrolase [Muribaculaceae bacterium]
MKIARFEFSLFGINTYAVFDPATRECAIIDPGMSSEPERKAIEHFITDNGLTLTHIINTHLHIDHAIGNSWLKSHFPAPVEAHEADLPLGSRMMEQAAMFGIPIDTEAVVIDRPLHNGDSIKIGHGTLEVIHVPGHSKGSIALYDKADGFLISGDALFAGSVGRTDLPGGNGSQLIDSITTRLLTLPPDTVVYPGHGPATTIGHEAATNPFLH